MTVTSIYRFLPKACQTGACEHEAGQCIRYRSRNCLSGLCDHAARGLMCGTSHPHDPEAPAPAPAPAPVDIRRPYAVRVVRTDKLMDVTLVTEFSNGTTEHVTALGLAQAEAARTRVHHAYYGPMTVYVWQQRPEGEHYRNPAPRHAQSYGFPAQPQLDPRRPRTDTID